VTLTVQNARLKAPARAAGARPRRARAAQRVAWESWTSSRPQVCMSSGRALRCRRTELTLVDSGQRRPTSQTPGGEAGQLGVRSGAPVRLKAGGNIGGGGRLQGRCSSSALSGDTSCKRRHCRPYRTRRLQPATPGAPLDRLAGGCLFRRPLPSPQGIPGGVLRRTVIYNRAGDVTLLPGTNVRTTRVKHSRVSLQRRRGAVLTVSATLALRAVRLSWKWQAAACYAQLGCRCGTHRRRELSFLPGPPQPQAGGGNLPAARPCARVGKRSRGRCA